ncbi:hypothetical protein AWM70_03275 [Paenibacillus yonginensis]|uniref:Uncharacterized protein n=1 Tax=Paenibacillus yonginensis TaxID=1462996 RepID=A0A1B1MX25_9BACL|nr:phage tail protein [Paenibacillus yonginensis]ANS73715.1 hypothetical protein AWM70_03275 [Paenibacillus yonginensis]
MAYEKQAPDWSAAGIEPPQSKRDSGWQVEDRPPAAWLNWFMNRTSESLKELQGKAAEKAWVEDELGGITVQDASLTQKGIVQLSSATDSAAEDRAATAKAVRDAAVQSKVYTDQQMALVTETGVPKLVSYPLLVTAVEEGQTEFEIPLDTFDANTDTLLISINRAVLDATQYTLTNTVRGEDGSVTQRAMLNLASGLKTGSKVAMVVLKNVPLGPEGAINGAVLAEGSIPSNRVSGFDAHLADSVSHVHYGPDTGTANAKVVTLNPAPVAYVEGLAVSFKNAVQNTGAVTINVNGLGTKSILKSNGSALSSGNLKVNSIYTLRYNGTVFILQGEGGEYGTAAAGDVRSGKTIGTDAGLVSGSLVTRDSGGAVTVAPGSSVQTLQAGIYDHAITVNAPTATPGNKKILYDFNYITMSGSGWKSAKRVICGISGTYRISITVQTSNADYQANVRIYKNGNPYGTLRLFGSFTPITYTEDLAFVAGDVIEVMLSPDNLGNATLTGWTFGVENFGMLVYDYA